MKRKIKKFKRDFKKIATKPEMQILPGQLAYFLVLSIIPTLTLFSIGAAMFNLSSDMIYDFFATAFNQEIAGLILSSNATFTNHFSIFVIVVIGYVIAANGAASIIITSNTIYGIKNRFSIRRYIKSFLMILILIFLLLFMLIGSMFGDSIILLFTKANTSKSVVDCITMLINIFSGPVMFFVLFLFIKLIYTIAPDKKINPKYTNMGSLFTAVAWIVITTVYSFYVNEIANYSALYGNLANLVILMLWFYFLSYAFTIGLALNYHKEEEETFHDLVLNYK